ncbi:MAG: hypothetical protein H0U54_09610 [Acidobacteria bacterium]|nr:hypothetical protein [Acidobacteriota bacterium]
MKRKLIHVACAFVILIASSVIALSQTREAAKTEVTTTVQSASEAQTRTSANETFDLSIAERRITERDFAASTSVEIGEETARGLSLRVGVAVGADQINVLLRNVRGSVRFRATLERVLQRLNARPVPGATP